MSINSVGGTLYCCFPDTINHNQSSITAKGLFHGTGISIFQLPETKNPGVAGSKISKETSNISKLSQQYTNVSAVN